MPALDDDILRIMVSTDNHLGFMDKDIVRKDDPFAAFEEVLVSAVNKNSDMVLLAGDLFHDAKPSRRVLNTTMKIAKDHSLGHDPVFLEFLNSSSDLFANTNGRVNFEDPCMAVSLPIFAIHGNHDEPSKDGGLESLSTLDIFAASNLINYFGKSKQVDDIEIEPILLKKGGTFVAIYGLGAIRDERLNRMWANKKVKFIRPKSGDDVMSFFNIFVIHQNRDFGRGVKNCIHEKMIPEWMDLVIWGNEHESVPQLTESLVGTFRILQPGSSVATSMSETESCKYPKHMCKLEIKGKQFRAIFDKYTQIRPFQFSDVSLVGTGLDPRDPKIEDKMAEVLTVKVREQIASARELCSEIEKGPNGLSYKINDCNKVLVRIKVENSGFPTLNPQRFGAKFMSDLANPNSILVFHKRKERGEASRKVREKTNGGDALDLSNIADMNEDDIERIQIGDLVRSTLENSGRDLHLLGESKLAQALDDYVVKMYPRSIDDLVEFTVADTQRALFKDKELTDIGKSSIAEASLKVRMSDLDSRKGDSKSSKGSGKGDVFDDDVSETEAIKSPARKTTKASSKSRAKKRPVVESDPEDYDLNGSQSSDNDAAPVKKTARSSSKGGAAMKATARRGARARAVKAYTEDSDIEILSGDYDDDDDVVEVVSVSKSARSSARSSTNGLSLSQASSAKGAKRRPVPSWGGTTKKSKSDGSSKRDISEAWE
jgi:double-strand break repair protein MRE11